MVVPQGIESVNGSSVDMGCTSSLVDSGGVMVCGGCSYLADGVSPDIDTSTSDWASQLVTARRNEDTTSLRLTFGFDTAVSLTRIEMDLFNCPDWNIGAQSINLYLNSDYNLIDFVDLMDFDLPRVFANHDSFHSSCDSLSSVTFSGEPFQTGSYRTFHILIVITSPIEWVHVGEVRFIGVNGPLHIQSTPSSYSKRLSVFTRPLPFTSLELQSCKFHYIIMGLIASALLMGVHTRIIIIIGTN